MANSITIERPDLTSSETTKSDRWYVTVYNNEYNTYLEVIVVLMLATHCTEAQAYDATWEIDHYGKAVVYVNCEAECRMAAKIISNIGVRVEVTPEP